MRAEGRHAGDLSLAAAGGDAGTRVADLLSQHLRSAQMRDRPVLRGAVPGKARAAEARGDAAGLRRRGRVRRGAVLAGGRFCGLPSVGDEVLRWHFHGASNQRWEIEYISNGLYSIKNKMSNLYLGVEALNSTSAITRQYSALGDSTKWYISKTSSGAYCFYAKGNLTYSYVIGADPLNNNTIVNMTYSNNSDYKDEWNLTEIKYYLHINSFFDDGYCVRFGEILQIHGENFWRF